MLSLKYRLMCICWFLWMSLCECLGQMSPQDCKTWNQLQCEDQWVPWGMFKKSVTFLCFAQHKDIWKIVGNQIVLVTIDFNCKNEKNPGKKRNPALSELDVWGKHRCSDFFISSEISPSLFTARILWSTVKRFQCGNPPIKLWYTLTFFFHFNFMSDKNNRQTIKIIFLISISVYYLKLKKKMLLETKY